MTDDDEVYDEANCVECEGSGRDGDKPCVNCRGRGIIKVRV